MPVFPGVVKKKINYCLLGFNEPLSFSSVKRGVLREKLGNQEETRALQ